MDVEPEGLLDGQHTVHVCVVLAVKWIGARRRRSGETHNAAASRYDDVERVVLVGGDGVVLLVLVDDG